MAEITYLDFDLLLERSGTGYRTRVLGCPAVPAACDFTLPFSDLELENFLLKIGHPRRHVRRLESGNVELAKDFGRRLFEAAFGDEVRSCLRQSLDVAGQQGAGLRLRLHLTGAPELADLPWEFLYDPSLNRFFVLSGKTPLVRYLDLPERIRPLAVQPPIRVLAMISTPSGYPPLDANREWAKLEEAVTDLRSQGLVAIERLEQASLTALQRRLRRGEYHVFHFIGHGRFDERTQDGVLLMEKEAEGGRVVSGQELGTLLHDHTSLRLAILNACEGARASRTDPFAGTAQSLVQQGIPAVIAMQFEVADETAILFAHEFYGAVADGYPVDTALAEARKAVFARGDDLEWGTPVLYMRAPDGRVFDFAGKITPPVSEPRNRESAQRLAELYDQALGYYYTDQWAQAIPLFNEIVAEQPGYEDSTNKLAEATRQQTLLDNYSVGQHAYQAGDWAEAIRWLEATEAVTPGYRDAAALLAEARRQRELADLYTGARRVFKTGNWQAVIKVWARIVAIAPDYPDPDGLLEVSRERLAAQEREQQAAAAYSQGLRHLDAKRWAMAVAALEQVEVAMPGYQQAAALLARARQTLAEQQAAEQREARASALYQQATQALNSGQLTEAIGDLETLGQVAPGYKDAEALLARARQTLAEQQAAEAREARADALYRQATQALKIGKLAEAIEQLQSLNLAAPGYRDTEALLARARQDLAERQAAEEREARADALYRQATIALRAGRLAEAIGDLETLGKEVRGYRDAEALLAQAQQTLAARAAAEQRQAQVTEAYRRADDALAARDWDTATELLARVQGIEPGYRDVASKLAKARQQQTLARRFGGAVAHMHAKRWAEAVRVLREILAQAPEYADPAYGSAADMLSQALQEKERAELPPPPAPRRGRPKDTPR